jgi:hypothetical protein
LETHKLRAEDALFESATVGCVLTEENADEMSKQKEQLFIQYTNWVLKAKSAREINNFRYRMLKKRAKTSLQYWQVDGAEFPAIRAVALTVFSIVASSAASERGLSILNDGIRSFKDAQSSRKWKGQALVVIKTNTPQLLSNQAGAEWEESVEGDGDEERWSSLE